MKALVCFSGGLDSTVALYWANKQYEEVVAVFFNYGQKAYVKEKEAVHFFCNELGVELLELNLSFVKSFSGSALNDEFINIPESSEIDLDNTNTSIQTAKAVWVPNRNGLFINTAAVVAEFRGIKNVVVGFNLEEAQTFADNSEDFIKKTNEALSYSTRIGVEVVSPTLFLRKKEIVDLGKKHNVFFQKLWPCYKNESKICGECESCKRYLRAMGES